MILSPRVVLMRPKYSRNVGMVSRAMSNFGLNELVLIAPRCKIDQQAHEGAAEGQGPLEKIKIYTSWQDYSQKNSLRLRLAFSRRVRRHHSIFELPDLLCDKTAHKEIKNRAIDFVFGPEDHGLSEEDIAECHRTVILPLPGEVGSMNLSHAVVCALTLTHFLPMTRIKRPTATASHSKKKSRTQPTGEINTKTIFTWLETLQFDLTSHAKTNAFVILRQFFQKALPTEKEARILETVIQQTLRKLRANSKKK